MRKIFKMMALLLVVIMIFAGCSSSTSTSDSNAEKTDAVEKTSDTKANEEPLAWDNAPKDGVGKWVGYYRTEARILNPINYSMAVDNRFMSWFYGRLYRFLPGADGTTYEVTPSLAESKPVDVNGDGLTWDIKVRDGLTWSNGDPLTAKDFEYTLKQLYDPKQLNTRTLTFHRYFQIKNAKEYFQQTSDKKVEWEDVGVKVLDNNTLRFILTSKVSPFSIMNTFSSVHSAPVYQPLYDKLLSEDGTECTYGSSLDRVMSSGLFTIKEWNKDSNRLLVKNPNHPLANRVWWAEMEEKYVPDTGTALQLFENGELSYITLSSEGYDKYGEDPRIKQYYSTAVSYWAMNLANEDKRILNNKNFRLALFHAVDRATIAKTINCMPAAFYLSAELMGDLENGIRYRDTPQGKSVVSENHGYNPELAKEYFAKALKEEGITEKIVLEIKTSESSDARKEAAEQLQKLVPQVLGEDKLELTISQLPNSVIANQMRARDYETALGGYTYAELRPWGTMQVWASDYGGNVVDENGKVTLYGKRKHTPWYNDEYDKGWKELMYGETQFDTSKRLDLMAELEKLVLSEAPAVPVYLYRYSRLYSTDVELPMSQYAPGVEFGHQFSRPKK